MDEARRLHYLDAMGITVWKPRGHATATAQAEVPTAVAEAVEPPQSAADARQPTGAEAGKPATPLPAELAVPLERAPAHAQRHQGRAATGQPTSSEPPKAEEPPPWTDDDFAGMPLDDAGAVPSDPFAEAPAIRGSPNPVGTMDWPALKEAVAGCHACGLCARRTNTVFGVGSEQAELMFIGEGPGQDEDRKGEPFVGRAGRLLDRMLGAVGLAREQVYIANIVKCRPPNNRNPNPDEAAACRAFLERQIALIRPKLIVSLGAISANNLLGMSDSVGRLRGRSHHYQPSDGAAPIPLIVTYHPSYYLRSPAEKAKGWQDLQRIVRTLSSQI